MSDSPPTATLESSRESPAPPGTDGGHFRKARTMVDELKVRGTGLGTVPVCVITGGGSGMGLATARLMTDHHVVLVGRTARKLEEAARDLRAAGITVDVYVCDIADRESVQDLARFAAGLGPVTAVVHAAGQSPHMGSAQQLLDANALGTLYVNDAFLDVLEPGGCLVDVASMSAHLVPAIALPRWAYPMARRDVPAFRRWVLRWINIFPKAVREGIAYAISKDFVVWLARQDAGRFGAKGARVLSVSPGSFDTPMGDVEGDEAMALVSGAPIPRLGHVDEIAHLLAFCVGERAGYLTGTDILCDGGVVAAGISPIKRRPATPTASEVATKPSRAAADQVLIG